jgi:hypothetical protein
MTSDRQQILATLNIPVTREEVSAKLGNVGDAFLTFRDSGKEMKPSTREDWKGILDVMLYIDRDTGAINDDGIPQTDPLTAITAAERYQVLGKKTADTLRADFMAQVQAIAGTGLTQGQIKKLFRLCATYNPVKAMEFGNQPKP